MLKKLGILFFIIGLASTSTAQTNFKGTAEKAAAPLMSGKLPLKGVVIGIIKGNQKEVYSFGELITNRDANPGEILFETASITKNLTALLLARAVSEGGFKYDDITIKIDGNNITWKQLVTHTAGLPSMPNNIDKSTTYTLKEFNKFIEECRLDSKPGEKFSYSTAGYSLLGKLISEKEGYRDFGKFVEEKILKPAGMLSSIFEGSGADTTLYAASAARLKNKHSDYVLNPSGGMISSANDLLRFIEINLYPEKLPGFEKSLRMTQEIDEKINTFPGSVAALGWHFFKGMNVYWNTGVTDQSRCIVMFDSKNKCGTVILTNSKMAPSDPRLEVCAFGIIGQLRQLK